MAVKQNNEVNEVQTSVNDKTSGSNGNTTAPANVSGVMKVTNGAIEQSSIDVTNKSLKLNLQAVAFDCDTHMELENQNYIGVLNSKTYIKNDLNSFEDIANILDLIDLVKVKREVIAPSEWGIICHHILYKLSRVRQPNIHLARFKENIEKIGEFFANTNDKAHYLRIVCQIVMQTKADAPTPSCALAIIFQLFSADVVNDAVQSLLDMNYSNQKLKQTVHVLCDWMGICTFCPSLNVWIYGILRGLQARRKYELFDDICLENIFPLFILLIVPIFRPKVAPIVFHMLSHTQQRQVFHKILPKLLKVLLSLQQQANLKQQPEETRQTLKQLISITTRLSVRFHGYDEIYEPLMENIKDLCGNYDYMPSVAHFEVSFDEQLMDYGQRSENLKVGLVNLGNTCYMNSVLQALAMTKAFAREIIMYQCTSPLIMNMRQQIALMLYSNRFELTPSRLLNATRPPGFAPGVQQDSSEYLGYLLETLHEQDVSARKDENQEECNGKDVALIARAAKQETKYTNGTENDKIKYVVSTVDKIFNGKLATTYKCLTCGCRSYNVDSFRDLQLSFPEVANEYVSNYSVQDLIDFYCSPEKLSGDNQYYCGLCKKLSDAERCINIKSAPKNLILTLKHFKYDQKYHMRSKLLHKVVHDEKITVKEVDVETLNEVNIVQYNLYAGVVHSGLSMDSGHYYTYASDSTNEWFKFNDNIVTSSKSEELHNLTPPNTPYILFYQMCARSCPENGSTAVPDSCEITDKSQFIKIETPLPLQIDDLPTDLRDYIKHDNCLFADKFI